MKIAIQKTVGDLGEVWMVEVPVDAGILKGEDPVVALKAKLAPALRVLDDRLLDLNLRLLNRNKMAQSLGPEANMAIHQVVQVMYGRASGPIIVDRDGQIVDTQPDAPRRDGGQPEVNPHVEKASDALSKALEAADHGGRQD